MTKKIRVLVFPAGEINSIELHDALSSNVNVELFGASSRDMVLLCLRITFLDCPRFNRPNS